MAIALVTSVSAGFNSSGATSSSVDSTGGDLIVMVVGHYSGAGTPAISDSKGNSWTALTSYTYGNERVTIFYAKNATVGSGHTFTANGANSYASFCVGVFSGSNTTAPFDAENGSGGNGATSQPGSITPSEANCLVIVGTNLYPDGLSSIDGGFTILENKAGSPGFYEASALAYLIQTSAAAANPTLTHVSTTNYADAIASFKAAGAAGVSPKFLTLLGVG